jgi:uncharacterized OB-fold protein
MRYPPMPACPFCGSEESGWVSVDGRGAVYSYTEVHHATNPAFKMHVPYTVAIVALDVQSDRPLPGIALRIPALVVDDTGEVASPATGVGINTRMRMVFRDVSDALAVPLWTVDAGIEPAAPSWTHSR